jgi:heme iron utilization protein
MKRIQIHPIFERLKVLDGIEQFAVLATEQAGHPYVSLVAYTWTEDMKRILFATDRDTRKYKNILRGGYVAFLIDNRARAGKALEQGEAFTITGRASVVRRGATRDRLTAHYIQKHPLLEEFVKSPATALVAVQVNEVIHVTQFKNVVSWKREGKG